MTLRFLFDEVSRRYRRWLPAQLNAAQDPLVEEAELQELALYAQSLPSSLLDFERPAAHPLIGETPSMYRGRGLEFAENRPYQSGDEPRLLNWRLYARAGSLYTKVFAEERRPQVFLLVDRRAAMRFATRRQLKAALAAKIGACFAYHAQHQALAVGGLILNESAEWFAPAMGDVSLRFFVQSLAAPCPPLAFDRAQPSLEESLRLLIHRLPGGCFVLLVSDFADLDPYGALPLLHEIADLHTVRAIQILDPVEQGLPVAGDFLIEDTGSPQPLRIDGRDRVQQARYAQAFSDHQSMLAACFTGCGIPFKTSTTQDDVNVCLGAA